VRPHDVSVCVPSTVSVCPRPQCQHLCPTQALVFGHGDLLSKAAAGRKVLEYLDREPTGDTGGTRAPTTLQGHVAFHHVSFAYPTRPEHLVLQVELGVSGVPKERAGGRRGVTLSTHRHRVLPTPGRLLRAAPWRGDGVGGAQRQREEHVRGAAGAIPRARGRGGAAGPGTAAGLRARLPAPAGEGGGGAVSGWLGYLRRCLGWFGVILGGFWGLLGHFGAL